MIKGLTYLEGELVGKVWANDVDKVAVEVKDLLDFWVAVQITDFVGVDALALEANHYDICSVV